MDSQALPPGDSTPSLPESLRGTLAAVRDYLAELAELAAVEARLSLTTLVVIAMLCVAGALLAVTAWLAVTAALVALAVAAGASWPTALVGAALGCGLACVCLVVFARRLIRRLGFTATREGMALQPASNVHV